MARFLIALAYVSLTLTDQNPGPVRDRRIEPILSFESQSVAGPLADWGGAPTKTLFADGQVVHSGKFSARIERTADSPNQFSSLTRQMPVDFTGSRIEFRGFLRTEDVSGFAGLWMREDDDANAGVAFDNMQSRGLQGTTEWTEYSIVLPLKPEARRLYYGVLASGTGKTWADDLQLLVDGKSIWEAPHFEPVKTAINLDHEFDSGSGISATNLTGVQIANLATLGKVWGFLKYHHPAIAGGKRHWDYDLFRVMPAILAAPDHATANAALLRWIDSLGAVAPCKPCATLNDRDLDLPPQHAWIADELLLGVDLSHRLLSIDVNRPAGDKQFYISRVPEVANPVFENEPAYSALKVPDAGFQLLGLYRYWNIIEYWSPNRKVMGEDWNQILTDFIPRIAFAKDRDAYQTEFMALIAKVNDTHANLWSSIRLRPPLGDCQLPVTLRFIENRAVVVDPGAVTPLKAGDIIDQLDGVPVAKLVETWTPLYADSNQAARLRDMAASMTRGACGKATVSVIRGSEQLKIAATRVPPIAARFAHDLLGDTFRRLSDDVAYLKLSSVKVADAAHYIDAAAGTKGLIIDIRNYPSEFMVFALGSLLVDRPTEFVRFTIGDASNPGAFHWGPPLSLQPARPHYPGKVIVLVDEITQSQAEYTTMAFRAAHATVLGSTTAGADGNVSQIALPGGLNTMISGIGVFYPDKKPTQRVGIVPDVEVKPTIAGIRDGRDELLEAAIRQILGPEVIAAQIEKMIH
jgi:C-terminal processing protease CtpA/Prc